MKLLFASLLLVVVMLTGGLVRAQDSEIITVTGRYSSYEVGEYQYILVPCGSSEVWDVETNTPAFTALARVYAGLERTQLERSRALFVEVRVRYRAYEEPVHTQGVFEIAKFVRHSTVAADYESCTTAPVSPDLVDG